MNELLSRHCTRPDGKKPLDIESARALVAKIGSHWKLDEEGKSLYADFNFQNFHETMSFTNAVAWIANREDHHPDMEIGYRHCLVRYTTHAIAGLSENDFICAAKIDALLS